MHELGIARDLWAVILRYAKDHALTSISRITLVIGEASGFEKEYLEHSLRDHIMPGTIAAGADIVFEIRPLAAVCTSCRADISKEMFHTLGCPRCGSGAIEITSGKESYVHSIEGE